MDIFGPAHGALLSLPSPLIPACLLLLLMAVAWRNPPVPVWGLAGLAALVALGVPMWAFAPAVAVVVLLSVPPLRRPLISNRIAALLDRLGFLPTISATEQAAIDAGSVWIDGDLFSGLADAKRVAAVQPAGLTEQEQAFLDGPVAEVCAMTDDWSVWADGDLPQEVWQKLKDAGLFGMIIPTRYGGLGLSPSCNSATVARLSTRSLPLAITVMVPNSLGPAELLIHYGTEAQKDHYLPRLAKGEEIPCFALTEPGAGSDAGALQADGVVFRGDDGELQIRLNWNKRWITLAPVATVLGLAFRLRDPENLLGRDSADGDLGITCALVPTDTPGVVHGRCHDPLGVPFFNGPTQGHDVVVGVDAIIGGADGAGRGWSMLMDCLAAGRGISLPATSTGGAQMVARTIGAHAGVRKQFGLPIGRFEGVEEALARIAGSTYLLEAARRLTNAGLDAGEKPAVITAVMKYTTTEIYREVIQDGMDVQGGAAISRGPRNLLAHAYAGTPIGITVEGANILTRTLMVFGQGAIRCHPYALREIQALAAKDMVAFDRAFTGHVGHVISTACRAVAASLTRGFAVSPGRRSPVARHWRRLRWTSVRFALYADLAMGTLGGNLKRREMLTGRFADIFAALYLGTATLRRWETEGCIRDDLPLVHHAMERQFAKVDQAFEGIFANLNIPGLSWLLRGPLSWWSRLNRMSAGPSDRLTSSTARTLLEPGAQRDRLTPMVFRPSRGDEALVRLDTALERCTAVEPVLRKVKDAMRAGTLSAGDPERAIDAALAAGVVHRDEAEQVRVAAEARADAIQVDDFEVPAVARHRKAGVSQRE